MTEGNWTPPKPDDVCECGDYRRNHPGDGPCNFNKSKGGIGHGGPPDCPSFRLSIQQGEPK